MPKQTRVNVYLSEEDYEFLKQWAVKEKRSMSNLAAICIEFAIETERKRTNQESQANDQPT